MHVLCVSLCLRLLLATLVFAAIITVVTIITIIIVIIIILKKELKKIQRRGAQPRTHLLCLGNSSDFVLSKSFKNIPAITAIITVEPQSSKP